MDFLNVMIAESEHLPQAFNVSFLAHIPSMKCMLILSELQANFWIGFFFLIDHNSLRLRLDNLTPEWVSFLFFFFCLCIQLGRPTKVLYS